MHILLIYSTERSWTILEYKVPSVISSKFSYLSWQNNVDLHDDNKILSVRSYIGIAKYCNGIKFGERWLDWFQNNIFFSEVKSPSPLISKSVALTTHYHSSLLQILTVVFCWNFNTSDWKLHFEKIFFVVRYQIISSFFFL